MKKKLLTILLILCVVVPATLSAKVFDISLGPNVQFKPDFDEISSGDMGELFGKIENYAFGADLRMKILLAEVDLVGTFAQAGSDSFEFEVLPTVGLSFDLFGFTRLGIGLGPHFIIRVDDNGNATVVSGSTSVNSWESFGDAFVKSRLALRTTADFKIGKMWLGASYTLDTNYTLDQYEEFSNLFNADWSRGRFGVSLLFSFF